MCPLINYRTLEHFYFSLYYKNPIELDLLIMTYLVFFFLTCTDKKFKKKYVLEIIVKQ